MALVGASSICPIWSGIKARKFQPLYIMDLVEGILRAVNQRLGGLYNITGEEAIFIEDYLHKLSCLTGLTERFASLQEEAFNVGQSTQRIDPEFSYFLIGEPGRHHRVYDSGKLRREIGNYARWPLVRGLGATLQWYHATGALPSLITSFKGQQGGQLCMSH
jgi:nucleoside-diphosphate-sugar epimerase